MNSGEELQRLLFTTLNADTQIKAIANGVYDRIPEQPFGTKTAYISFGPMDANEDDADCITGISVAIQLDVWSRAVGFLECRNLTDLVRKKLHRASLTLNDNALVDIWVTLTRVFRDPDGLTSHGVVQVTCMVEEP